MEGYMTRLNELYPQTVAVRRRLHQHPELSYHESNTASFVYESLSKLGLDVRKNVGGNGVTALLRGGKPGPTVALRADIDALPIQDEKQCDYASKVQGVMHACGHDAHTAALLSAAECLSERRSELRGNIRFIFQHAEEVSPGGAISMIKDGVLDDVDAIYGVHLWTPLPTGIASSSPGAVMGIADEFHIHITGKGGHGGLPHQAIDSVVIGSQLVMNLQSIVSRAVDPIEPCVVSVGSIHAGSGFNVIAESCKLSGTVRTFSENVRDKVVERIRAISEQTCAMFGATVRVDYKYGYPPVVNDAVEAERFFQTGTALFGEDRIKPLAPLMAGEDFAYYLQRVPGCFVFVGAGNTDKGIIYPHHHPKFDIDEPAMIHSASLLIALALNYMKQAA